MAAKRRNVKSHDVVDAHERNKDFLTEGEVAKLLAAAKKSRYGIRDHLIILMLYRHGLRVSELTSMKRSQIKLDEARLWVKRLKNSLSLYHPIEGDELRAIKRYMRERSHSRSPFLIISERGQPLTRQAVHYLIKSAGERACLSDIHPHMLRHACGYKLANDGMPQRALQDYLGHRDPKHTAHYSRISERRFEGLWI